MSIEKHITSTLVGLCRGIGVTDPKIVLEIPKVKGHGDLSSNVAMIAAKQVGMPPRELAEKLAAGFQTDPNGVQAVSVAGPGFLNFRLSLRYFHRLLKDIVTDPSGFGSSDEGGGDRWLFEYVSANPTGPLNIVSARAASVGDTLVRIFRKRGFNADSEFYANNYGGQVRKLGASVRARIKQIETGAETADIPEGGYHGEYLINVARALIEQVRKDNEFASRAGLEYDDLVGGFAAIHILKSQKGTLKRFGVTFDRWFYESELYDEQVLSAYNKLKDINATFSRDGAEYFKASEFGDSEDRVIMTSEDRFTYVVPDIAYHLNKRDRGYIKAVDLLGPDHHGHIVQLRAALSAIGLPSGFFHPIIVQQVNLKRGDQDIKMSKRAGVGITLDELIDEVGVDAARFFFLMRKITSHLDFDMELAKRHSEDNPVYYIQYAHARIRSIFRQPGAEDFDDVRADLDCLTADEEMDLLRALARFPWTLEAIVRGVEPHPLTTYLTELARSFHLFYSRHRVISDDERTTAARLTLCKGVAGVLSEGLQLMGVSAPEVM